MYLGGHTNARTHRPEKETIGSYLIKAFYDKINHFKNVHIIFNSTVSNLWTDEQNSKITGIQYFLNDDNKNLIALTTKAVVLATGGFGSDFFSDDSLLKEFTPEKAKFPTTNGLKPKV